MISLSGLRRRVRRKSGALINAVGCVEQTTGRFIGLSEGAQNRPSSLEGSKGRTTAAIPWLVLYHEIGLLKSVTTNPWPRLPFRGSSVIVNRPRHPALRRFGSSRNLIEPDHRLSFELTPLHSDA